MRAVVQRVSRASVRVDGEVTGAISRGLLVLVGVGRDDTEKDAEYLLDKVLGLRIFPDADGKMNRSVEESGGGLLVISQFTLFGDVRRGRRPSFDAAAGPVEAKALYEYFVQSARRRGLETGAGVFQAHMDVELVNDGPVTILLDSRKLF
jgi:D-tyrosyl-tRNA(Tyr) deacylase